MAPAENKSAKKYEFKAEVQKLLEILVHSLYTNREIFLRELVSNASDALDKLRFETTRGVEVIEPDRALEIRIETDEEARTITVQDSGIGMDAGEVIQNLGTIARSGTADFLARAAEAGGEKGNGDLSSVIGKFGVGFYSAFMVADSIVVTTRSHRAGAKAVQWRSDGLGTYELEELDGDHPRGTRIEVHLKEEAKEFAAAERAKHIIKTHSNFVSFPVFVGEDRVNTIEALWRQPKFKIEDAQYAEFYKFLTYDMEAPFETVHIAVDAPVQFTALLFVPKHPLGMPGARPEAPGLDLYVRHVLVQKGNTDILPDHLGFIRGVVDSEDLPLNISRETLQENTLLRRIAESIRGKLMSHFEKMAADEGERWAELWEAHGRMLKMGYADYKHRDAYANLLRFDSSFHGEAGHEEGGLTSLGEYAERMKDGQKAIYYVVGASRAAARLNPHVEMFRKKGLEVLYLTDPLDEFALDALRTFGELPLQSVEQVAPESLEELEDVEREDAPDPLDDAAQGDLKNLLRRMKEILGDRVEEVRSSERLSESACCLVNPEDGMTSSMQRIMQIVSQDTSVPKKILEVNPNHRLTRNLLQVYRGDATDAHLELVTEQLYESALLLEGYLKDPHTMVNRIQGLLDDSTDWYLSVKGS